MTHRRGKPYEQKIGTVGVIVAAALIGCGGEEESSELGTPYGRDEADNASQSFAVRLDRATTEENVIPRILAAGHDQLVAACEAKPAASVRILNPLASEEYADVSCASVLGDGSTTGEARAALVTDEIDGPIGEAQQRIGPISALACGIAGIGTTLFTRYALCPQGRTERARRNCEDAGIWGTIGIGVLCMIPF
jgi:hypothetical protein